ncbi:MAG: NAD(P)H-dependent glycerol-3-phosphate dehydrogenase [Legionella sp.]|nr:NAD(P)H-dependent glycerol-3-phosphate dehydrogenase [Legionella sp.]
MKAVTKKIAMLGAGSWGTAVAIHLAACGNEVLLWGHDPLHIAEMSEKHANQRYLPSIPFPDLLKPTVSLKQCLDEASIIIIAVPSHAFAEILAKIETPPEGIAWLTKGLDPATHCLLSELVFARWGESFPIAVISGPSFAGEVAKFLPTALTLAGNNPTFQKSIRACLHHKNLRVYLSNDVIGVQLCGAVKNVLAIACGISDGLGYGANAKAALITRGLAEMSRLGRVLGAREESFLGLAGVGDLVLTCTDNQSRNRRFGLHLGHGKSAPDAEKEIGQVVEGKYNATQVCTLARHHNVEMPICEQVEALLNNKVTPQQAVFNLMNRTAREE